MIARTLALRPMSVLLLSAAFSLCACHRGPTTARSDRAKSSAVSSLSTSQASLYDLSVALVDQNGRAVTLDGYRGKPVLISMFYASCPYACPTLISQLQRLEDSLPAESRRDLRVLLVSIDPERDTPHKLKQMSSERHVDEARWRLARASVDDVRLLAAALGIKYQRRGEGGFNHSSVVTVLDQQGFVRVRSDGLSQKLDEPIADAITLLSRN